MTKRKSNGLMNTIRSKMFWLGALSVVPAYFMFQAAVGNQDPRKMVHGGLTLPQIVNRSLYDGKKFSDNPEVEFHQKELAENLTDFDRRRKDIWDNVIFWYCSNFDKDDGGLGMESYSDIVKGIPGSCTEGAVAFYANLRNTIALPGSKDKIRHSLLLITYEKSDNTNAAGHCLYLGEITSRETGEKRYFIAGINPFEDPNVEYDSIAEAIEENTNHFRAAFKGLTEQGVMIRPEKYCVIDPDEIGLEIVFDDKSLNVKHKGRDVRQSLPKFIQGKYMNWFDKNAKPYLEPEHPDFKKSKQK